MPALLSACLVLIPAILEPPETPFEEALNKGAAALAAGRAAEAQRWVQRALERDARSPHVWELQARVAELRGDRDEQIHSLHVRYRLLRAQGAAAAQLGPLRARLLQLDPLAGKMLAMRKRFLAKLLALARQYEKDDRPHSAIRTYQQILALDPEHDPSRAAIERISARPDPSLAATAKPHDLFAEVSEEWIRSFDAEHASWEQRAQLVHENYTTLTDAGYRVLVRAAEAMEQMNSFYREFFHYGTAEDGHAVPHIELRIFRNREEYLRLGTHPAQWSGGQFTGSAVETYVGQGGFGSMVTTLFHEAAHQFVGLATRASGWLNEGLASFFEGCRIQANGTVLMNYPANHRLFPLAQRMEQGWMSGPNDGIDPADPAASHPTKAPTFRTVVEGEYAWGPPWYAPTWGLVYFLYNFQDPLDGRFVYRAAFRSYIDASGGLRGETAIHAFEETVLANPLAPTRSAAREDKVLKGATLPRTIDDLNELWKDWILRLRDRQSGIEEEPPPYLRWARYAIERKELGIAQEHFEKGIAAAPDDPGILIEFADFLATRRANGDRASKLMLAALKVLEHADPVDEKLVRECERRLARYDHRRHAALRIGADLRKMAGELARSYLSSGLPLMAMEVSWRLGNQLGYSELFNVFEEAVRSCGRSLELWRLAYDEKDLKGWKPASPGVWEPAGAELLSHFGRFAAGSYDYDFLTLDEVTSGDFSMETELLAKDGEVPFAGLVFGRKDASTFHAALFIPGRRADPRYGKQGRPAAIDLTTFYGSGEYKTWRHNPAGGIEGDAAERWHKLRVDISGRFVDLWFDGEFVVTHEFPSTAVLHGSFGLFTGPGTARWRNVRYISRQSGDPAARIQRELVLERLQAAAAAEGRRVGGSWIGEIPPWPEVAEWVQEPRQSWAQSGPTPILVVLWSLHQNEVLPIDAWLRELAERHRGARLHFVSVASFTDRDRLRAYLGSHPFPGSVAADASSGSGPGSTFARYSVPKFNLPRLLLLDIDHRVIWEGDPGFRIGQPYRAGMESYLDVPLRELIAKRKLERFYPWIASWKQEGARIARGDLVPLAGLLRESAEFDPEASPLVADARRKLAALQAALADLQGTARTLAESDARPALETLLAWGAAIEKPVAVAELKGEARAILRHRSVSEWHKAVKFAAAAGKNLTAARRPEIERAAARLEKLSGPLCSELAARLRSALAAGGLEGIRKALEEAPDIPARWLARHFFGW